MFKIRDEVVIKSAYIYGRKSAVVWRVRGDLIYVRFSSDGGSMPYLAKMLTLTKARPKLTRPVIKNTVVRNGQWSTE